MTEIVDILIVGGGMAGMSLGAELAERARVLVIEQEAQPGYHATGRSVAFWTESYGGIAVQPLTTASGPMLAAPDPAFADAPLMQRRGALHIGRARDAAKAEAFRTAFASQGVEVSLVDRTVLAKAIPGLKEDWVMGVAEPSTCDIDAAALLGAYRRLLRQRGGELACARRFLAARREGEGWSVDTDRGAIACRILVNAAGAWADGVARASGVAPMGIRPLRRTVVQLRVDPPFSDANPIILGLDETFYFKSISGGRLWLSPHDEEPDEPGDAAPDELGVAIAIDRLEHVVDWRITALEHKWAGLRSFARDRAPIYGFDPLASGFFWFAGQGGFGIQTAPAAALIGAALVLGEAPDPRVAHIDPMPYSADRFDL